MAQTYAYEAGLRPGFAGLVAVARRDYGDGGRGCNPLDRRRGAALTAATTGSLAAARGVDSRSRTAAAAGEQPEHGGNTRAAQNFSPHHLTPSLTQADLT